MRHRILTILALTMSALGCQPSAAQNQKNATGLPTYPKDEGGVMLSEYTEQPFGKVCIFYSTDTNDALAAVEAWYRKALPAATVDDVNKNSAYGPIVLNGIKLLSGKDVVAVYRMPKGDHTVIELFKCR